MTWGVKTDKSIGYGEYILTFDAVAQNLQTADLERRVQGCGYDLESPKKTVWVKNTTQFHNIFTYT